MIRFELADKPEGFETEVEIPGAAWLAEHPTGRPKDLWGAFKSPLAYAFGELCAYSAIYEPVGTVDHFVSVDEDRARAYDWSNFRYASGWINSSKQAVRAADILDPFEVEDGWFEILLPSLQLVVADALPLAFRARAEFVLQRLHLRDDERVLRSRRAWYALFQSGDLSLEGLRRRAPLIAAAVDRQRTGHA